MSVTPAAARLTAITSYPVKACQGTSLAESSLGVHGLAGDREWMVVRGDGRFLSQRTHPLLARVRPAWTSTGLHLECEGLAPLLIETAAMAAAEPCEVSVWGDVLAALDAGPAAALWLEQALGTAARLVRVAAGNRRCADRNYVGERDVPVAFADGYPLLVCSSGSLQELNRRLEMPVPMDRFRPNLVLEGFEPFAEDRLRRLRIGAIELELVKPCTRCSVPGIDQHSGQPSNDPFPALKAFRYDPVLRGATFGVNAIARGLLGASLRVGMAVEVES